MKKANLNLIQHTDTQSHNITADSAN